MEEVKDMGKARLPWAAKFLGHEVLEGYSRDSLLPKSEGTEDIGGAGCIFTKEDYELGHLPFHHWPMFFWESYSKETRLVSAGPPQTQFPGCPCGDITSSLLDRFSLSAPGLSTVREAGSCGVGWQEQPTQAISAWLSSGLRGPQDTWLKTGSSELVTQWSVSTRAQKLIRTRCLSFSNDEQCSAAEGMGLL